MLSQMVGEDVVLIARLAPELGTVMADPTQIAQVLMNLSVNARDAMPDGGTLTFETANVELDEEYVHGHAVGRPGPYVMLAVTDTGIGMDRETQSHVFEPFFTTKPEGVGTGLGLATVYGIVKQSGGFIWVYSEPQHGATFKIYLPRVDQPAEPPSPVVDAATPRGHETILLVEDQDALREMILEVLVEHGYTLLAAANGAEALEVARRHAGPLHLLLTDVVMPGMSGRELTERLLAERPGLRVLHMSGYTNGSIEARGLSARGVLRLEKPFASSTLMQAVRRALEAS
jgi:CheY-like chemotaxis protein